VEAKPGKKNAARVQAFLQAAKKAQRAKAKSARRKKQS
jgi:hypothetical protein